MKGILCFATAVLMAACVVKTQPRQPAGGYPQETYGGNAANPQSAPGWSGGGTGQPGYGQPGYGTPPGGPTGVPDSGPVSVTIRSSCPQTVRVFFGAKPKYGSGTYSTISSNSVQSFTMRQGDQISIVDPSDNGISNFTASPAVREAEINSSCTGFQIH